MLGLVLAGAATIIVSLFLPLCEPVGLFRMVQQTTMIQHGGWQYAVFAVGLGIAGFRAFLNPKRREMVADGRLVAYRINPRFVRYDLNEVDAALQPYGGSVTA